MRHEVEDPPTMDPRLEEYDMHDEQEEDMFDALEELLAQAYREGLDVLVNTDRSREYKWPNKAIAHCCLSTRNAGHMWHGHSETLAMAVVDAFDKYQVSKAAGELDS